MGSLLVVPTSTEPGASELSSRDTVRGTAAQSPLDPASQPADTPLQVQQSLGFQSEMPRSKVWRLGNHLVGSANSQGRGRARDTSRIAPPPADAGLAELGTRFCPRATLGIPVRLIDALAMLG
jgi:hypothetical protein